MSPPLWRKIQRTNFTSIEELSLFLELSYSQKTQLLKRSPFPLNLPRRLAQKAQKGTLNDPITRQFIPFNDEETSPPEFQKDPVGDLQATQTPKLLKKYHNRALVITTSACAMHCRYCFRRHYPYETKEINFEPALSAIETDPLINEVILSGGDPLSLSDETLRSLLNKLALIDHIKRVRFHSRFPIGIPERIDTSFLSILEKASLQIVFVIHSNHPRELDEEVLRALKKIQCLGIPVLNQAVLLKGVNDTIEVMQELCERLGDHGILPYYIHQLDRVTGGAHFEVPVEEGLQLMEELSKRVSGYCLPKYVQEIAGKPSKTPLHSLDCLKT